MINQVKIIQVMKKAMLMKMFLELKQLLTKDLLTKLKYGTEDFNSKYAKNLIEIITMQILKDNDIEPIKYKNYVLSLKKAYYKIFLKTLVY